MIKNIIQPLSNNQFRYLAYIISLIPVALITGPFLADLIVSFCAVVCLYISFKNNFTSIFNHWIIKLLIVFWLYLLIKSLLNNEENYSILRSVFYIRYILFSVLVCFIYNYDQKFKKIFFRYTTYTLLILSLHAYIQHFFNLDLLALNFSDFSIKQNFSVIYNTDLDESIKDFNKVPIDYRISSLFGAESIMGSYVEKILPIYLGLMFLNKKSSKYIFFIVIFYFLIIISGERAAIALSFLFIFTLVLSFNLNNKKKLKFFSILFGISLLIFLNPNIKNRIIDNTLKNLTEIKVQSTDTKDKNSESGLNLNFFSIGHQGHYKSAFKIFIDNPILGIGIKKFRYECKKPKYLEKYSCSSHPHNTYLQLLSETGIIGFSFIFFIFLFLSYQIFKIIFFRQLNSKLSEHYKCFLIGLFINLWPIIPTGSFFNNWISICYFLSIGFFLGEIQKSQIKFKK